jgi:hypothetical protein
MSKRWWIVFGIALGLGCASIIVGIRLSGVSSFLENMLPGAGVSLIVFAIAVLLIEGSVMTRESRVRRVASMVSREVAKLNEEIGITLVREIGEYLASGLGSKIDLYGEERQDWKAFKRLLREVFKDVREVSARGLQESGLISEQDYLIYIGSVSRFVERVGSAMGNHLEVHAELVDLIERQRELNSRIQEANRNIGIWDEKIRCVRLAEIGEAIIDVIEACPRIKV